MENWPTQQSHDAKSGMVGKHGWDAKGVGAQNNLNDAVLRFPSPCATDYKGPGKSGTPRDRLDYAIERGITKSHAYPPPRTNNLCGGSGAWAQIQNNPNLTDEEKRGMTSTGGSLNPDWVEWLMLFPIGWTDLNTPNYRLLWLHPSYDPADDSVLPFIPRLTTRRDQRTSRINEIGNAQYPATAYIAFEWGMCFLEAISLSRECGNPSVASRTSALDGCRSVFLGAPGGQLLSTDETTN